MSDQYFRGHRVPTAAERRRSARSAPPRPLDEQIAAIDRESARVFSEGVKFWRSLRIGPDGRFTTRPR